MQIRIGDNKIITIYLEGNTLMGGVYVEPNHDISTIERYVSNFEKLDIQKTKDYFVNTKNINTYDEIVDHFKDDDNKYFITGITTSKFSIIDNNYPLSNFTSKSDYKKLISDSDGNIVSEDTENDYGVRSKIKFELGGANISAMILRENNLIKEYVLYLDTPNPIKYIDIINNFTTFKYLRNSLDVENSGDLIIHSDLVEEPKILSEVFIDRGINSVFEKIEKIKNIRNINDFTKFGNSNFKINSKGYEF